MTEEHKDAGANKYQNASLTQQEIDASRTTEFSALSERIRSVLLGWTRYFEIGRASCRERVSSPV